MKFGVAILFLAFVLVVYSGKQEIKKDYIKQETKQMRDTRDSLLLEVELWQVLYYRQKAILEDLVSKKPSK